MILICFNSILFGQNLADFNYEKTEFCDSNISEENAIQLRRELRELEDYFVEKGLLTDTSGAGYLSVYERIVRDNDLDFEMNIELELLNTLDFNVLSGCFYKALSPEQLSELTLDHLASVRRMSQNMEGDVSPAKVAQNIIDNFSTEDFELGYFKFASLLAFYQISSPLPVFDFGIPDYNENLASELETVEVILDEESKIQIDSQILTLDEASQKVYQFLSRDTDKKGLVLTPSRSASYDSYLQLLDMINSIYASLAEENGNVSKNIIFNKPK